MNLAHPSAAVPNGVSLRTENRFVLNSWKEIAEYMGRGVRTVQRWEHDLMLPVHRPAGKGRSAVLAFSDEIDRWMRKGALRSLTSDNKAVAHAAHVDLPEWRRLVTNSETLLEKADTLKTHMLELSRLLRQTAERRQALMNGRRPLELSHNLVKNTDTLQSRMQELSRLMNEAENRLRNTIAPPRVGSSQMSKHTVPVSNNTIK